MKQYGPRYYIDGRPAEVVAIARNGFITVIYDDRSFKDNIQIGEAHDWQPCDKTRVELQHAAAVKTAARMGLKI